MPWSLIELMLLELVKVLEILSYNFNISTQRATELPQQNSDVEVRNLRFIANYSI